MFFFLKLKNEVFFKEILCIFILYVKYVYVFLVKYRDIDCFWVFYVFYKVEVVFVFFVNDDEVFFFE